MATILDRWINSKKLEKRRQRALNHDLDSRFGDLHITAPTEGAWNQIRNVKDDTIDRPTTAADGIYGPDRSCERSLSDRRMPMENADDGSQKRNFTITIPLPWTSKKPRNRAPTTANSHSLGNTLRAEAAELSPRSTISSTEPTPSSFMSSPDPNAASSTSTVEMGTQSPATSPVIIYKPITKEYNEELAAMTRGHTRVKSSSQLSHEARSQNVSPINVTYKPASDDFAKEMAEVGMGPGPAIPQRDAFSRSCAITRTSPVLVQSHARPTPTPEQWTASMRMPPDSRPIPVNYSPEPRPFQMGLPSQPRPGTTRSTSQGPSADRSRIRHVHPDEIGSSRPRGTRSSSCAPPPESAGTFQLASRGPVQERTSARCSSSRGPKPSSHIASPAEPSERPNRTHPNIHHGRSFSRDPNSSQHPYREPMSSECSSAGTDISSTSSPSLRNNSFSHPARLPITSPSRDVEYDIDYAVNNHNTTTTNATIPGRGYYASVLEEYRQLAGDIEESEHERRHRQRQEARELVPDKDADDLC